MFLKQSHILIDLCISEFVKQLMKLSHLMFHDIYTTGSFLKLTNLRFYDFAAFYLTRI